MFYWIRYFNKALSDFKLSFEFQSSFPHLQPKKMLELGLFMNRWASNGSITEQAVRNIFWFNCMRTEFNVSSCCCFRILPCDEILSNLIESQRYIRCITSLWWKVETWKILFQQTQLRLSSIGGFRFWSESIFGRIPASPKLWLYLAQLNIAAVQHHWRFSHSWRNCTPYWHVLKSMNWNHLYKIDFPVKFLVA